MKNSIRKSATDKSISDVCGGLTDHFGISSLLVRLLFIFLPGNILIYLILVNIMGESPPSL